MITQENVYKIDIDKVLLPNPDESLKLRQLVSEAYQGSFIGLLLKMKQNPKISPESINELENTLKMFRHISPSLFPDPLYWPISTASFRKAYQYYIKEEFDKAIIAFSYAMKSVLIYPLYIEGFDFKMDFTPDFSATWDLMGLGGTISISSACADQLNEKFILTPRVFKEILQGKNEFYHFSPDIHVRNSFIAIKTNSDTLNKTLYEKLLTINEKNPCHLSLIKHSDSSAVIKIQEALDLLKLVCPEAYTDVETLTRIIVPYYTNLPAAKAFSVDSYLGCQFTSPVFRNQLFFAEQILHENCHNKLSSLMTIIPILKDTQQNKDAVYHHPWRADPRPIYGVLHAVYVSVSVATFYMRAVDYFDSDLKDVAFKRLKTLQKEIPIGMDPLLNKADLTPFGIELVSAMQKAVEKIIN